MKPSEDNRSSSVMVDPSDPQAKLLKASHELLGRDMHEMPRKVEMEPVIAERSSLQT